MKIALKKDIYQIDADCRDHYHLPTIDLMENAGEAVYRFIQGRVPKFSGKSYLIFCGPGNNGGDGAVLARKIFLNKLPVQVVFTGALEKSGEAALKNFQILQEIGVKAWSALEPPSPDALAQTIREADVIIDAIFGIGFHGDPDDPTALLIQAINSSGKTIISVDIPSGVYADGGVSKNAVRADFTVTLGLPKYGIIDFPGRDYAGQLITDGIHIPQELLEQPGLMSLLSEKDILPIIPRRKRDSHKGNYGHLLIIGNSLQDKDAGKPAMCGASALAGMASLRAGTGLLTLAVPEEQLPAVQSLLPEAMTAGLDSRDPEDSIMTLKNLIKNRKITAILAGNGFGTGAYQSKVMEFLLRDKPVSQLVIDADGINTVASDPGLMKALSAFEGTVILTPHIGEMARLTHQANADIKNNKISAALEAAKTLKVNIVVKDAVTVIVNPAGEVWVSDFGSAVLAKGGSGDILAGLVSGYLASGNSPLHSCLLAVSILGKSGEIYEEKFSPESALARDIIEIIPAALKTMDK